MIKHSFLRYARLNIAGSLLYAFVFTVAILPFSAIAASDDSYTFDVRKRLNDPLLIQQGAARVYEGRTMRSV